MFGFCQPGTAASGGRPDTLGRPAASLRRYLPSGDCAVRITEIRLSGGHRLGYYANDSGPEAAAATLRELGSGSPR